MSREKSGGLSVTTLLIASASAAAAAVVVPLFWQRGSIVAAAITPVIVTLVSESLRAPVTKVQEVGVWRRTPEGTAVRQPVGRDFQPMDPEEERIEIDPQQPDDPFGLYEGERDGGGFFTRRKVIIALVTGLIAFAIAAVVVTAGELTFGDSSSPTHKTTFFGGRKSRATPTPTSTPTATPKAGQTPTPTPSASATPTPSATPGTQATATPSATATPNAVAPATQATPAPTP
jgi:hypothetical protein